ncbi:uncharacterized protein [Montipora foliosa]|uniref:uncharacterized protein n=1 Tax=Montipora foliosa TaxID=591990 RepID=UPI0035F12E22
MSNLTVEKLEEILEEKLRKVIQPLSKQIEDAMQSVNALNTKYDQIVKTLKDLDEAKDKKIVENASLKAEILKSSNEVKFLKKSLNDMEQYTRRDFLEIRGIPLPSTPTDLDQTDEVVLQIAEKIGVPMQKSNISISHRIPSRKQFTDERILIPPAIIVKFVKREIRENLYRARKNLKSISTVDLGYSVANKIYVNESLTEKSKEIFKLCLKCKRDLSFKFLWTNAGRIFLRENLSSPVIPVSCTEDVPKR